MTAYRSYEDYSTSSNYYDGTRAAIGLEILLGVLAFRSAPLAGQSVLDVGCGTGNYLLGLQPYIGRLTGLEYNPGMLEQAVGKTKSHPSIELIRGSAFAIPCRDNTFDGVMFNQVIHHFDAPGGVTGDAFPMLQKALAEAHRVLRPGGVIALNHCLQTQLRDAYWWSELIPKAMERMALRYIPVPALRDLLESAGFEYGGADVPLQGILQAKDYLNPEGPLDETWRRGDSTWTLATESELESGLEHLRRRLGDGTIDAWLEERDSRRKEIGQTVYIWAVRL